MSAATTIAAVHAAQVNALKAIGTVIKLAPPDFAKILRRTQRPLVVHAVGGVWSTKYLYLTSYRGLAFFTKASKPIPLPPDAEIILAEEISLPM